MRNLNKVLPHILAVFTLISCTQVIGDKIYYDRNSEAGRDIMKVEQAARDFDLRQRESKYAVVARDFVSHATTKDTERMLRLTSKFTIKNDGQGLTRRNYMERVIPYFQGNRVEWNEESKIVSDDKGNRGFAFFGKISGRSSQFSTTVMRESGTIKIINIITE